MAIENRSLTDRALTRGVVRTATAPGSILLAGAAAAAGILAGGVVWGAVAGLVAWGARVAFAIPRRRRDQRIDLRTLQDPWRGYVAETLTAKARYDQVVKGVDDGPLKERLAEIGHRINDGVDESWRIAQRGQALQRGLGTLNTGTVRKNLAAAEHEARTRGANPSLQRRIEALTAQLETADRLGKVTSDAASRLQLLDARLDEAVARAVELSLSPDLGRLSGLGTDVDNLVGEMEALRQALDDTGGGTAQMGVA